MNLTGGELADMLLAAGDPGDALLIHESFGPTEANNRRCHLTCHSDQALRFARRRAATFPTLTALCAGSLADLANADACSGTGRP